MNVLFVCVANAGRSVMASYLFNSRAGGRHVARSAGSEPAAAPHANVVQVLAEVGIDASAHAPRPLDAGVLAWADLAVSTCSEEVCPATAGLRRLAWEFPDPKGLSLEETRRVRDRIEEAVLRLLAEIGAERTA